MARKKKGIRFGTEELEDLKELNPELETFKTKRRIKDFL